MRNIALVSILLKDVQFLSPSSHTLATCHFDRCHDLSWSPVEVLVTAAVHNLRAVAVRRDVHGQKRVHVRTQLQLLEGGQRGRVLSVLAKI